MKTVLPRLGIWLVVTGAALLVPFIGDWPWTASDYIIAGALIFGAACIYELLARLVRKEQRLIVAGVVFVLFALTYVELAVGLFGTPFAGS